MLNRDIIKYLAILAMLLNHIANLFLTPGTLLCEVFLDIGYFTAITMCYFLVEGYHYTRSKRKYGQRLLLFSILSQIPFMLAFHTPAGNMLLTLFLCFLILVCMERLPTGPASQHSLLFCLPKPGTTKRASGMSISFPIRSLRLRIRWNISGNIPCFRLCCTDSPPDSESCAPAY